jgi:hypothetical protein
VLHPPLLLHPFGLPVPQLLHPIDSDYFEHTIKVIRNEYQAVASKYKSWVASHTHKIIGYKAGKLTPCLHMGDTTTFNMMKNYQKIYATCPANSFLHIYFQPPIGDLFTNIMYNWIKDGYRLIAVGRQLTPDT